jgi:hypothetical protein
MIASCTLHATTPPETPWQKAVLKDIQKEEKSSITGNRYGEYGTLNGGTYTVLHFIIDAPDIIYDVVPLKIRTQVKLNKGKLDLPVNSTVLYRIEKMTLYLRDAHGQEGEFHIEKKTLKTGGAP